MRDLYRELIFRDFLGFVYFFSQMLLTSYIIILSAYTGGTIFLGESEQIYLTGGISKIKYFIGRLVGISLFIFLLWWTLFLLTGFILLITKTSYIEFYIMETFIKLCFNSIVLAFLSILLVGLLKNLVIGFTPILLAQFWFFVNNEASLETAEDKVLQMVNYILPVYSLKLFPYDDSWSILEKYIGLFPFHGIGYMFLYTAILLLSIIFLYTKTEF
jgi:hypothetical protein